MPPANFLPTWRKIMEGLVLEKETDTRGSVDVAYLDFLIGEFARLLPFDAGFYAAAGPPLPAGADPHAHFVQEGFRDGRLPHPVAFDAAYYLRRNGDLAGVFAKEGEEGLRSHFLRNGVFEGRVAHPDAEPDSERWWRAAANRTAGFAHRSIAHAMVQAFATPLLAGEPHGFRGGPVLGDGPTDRLLRHCRGGRPVDSFPAGESPVARLPGEYVYGGPFADHFGHVMAELVHRVLPSRTMFECRRLLFVGERTGAPPSGFDTLPRVFQAPLDFFGVRHDDVTVLHDDRIVEMLHIAQQGSQLTAGPLPQYLPLLSRHTLQHLALPPRAGRVFVSRSRLRPGGMVLGEGYLESLLEQDGWHIFHPQLHGLEEQMRTYASAQVLLFTEGSAVHGTELFGQDLGHCLLLPRRNVDTWWMIATLRTRAARFDLLPASTPLGTVLLHAITGQPLGNFGVSRMDFPAVVAELRRMGHARLETANPTTYRAAAEKDLERYLDFWSDGQHASKDRLGLVSPQDISSFAALARAAVAG